MVLINGNDATLKRIKIQSDGMWLMPDNPAACAAKFFTVEEIVTLPVGKSREMVDKLGELLSIFRDQMPDFNRNRADGDDIIGDTYEYLMRNFATESGKSKGQFYTPAEVSRVLAKVVGIEQVRLFFTNAEYEKLIKVMNDLGIAGSPDIVLIDARDNKPSASNVKGEA